MATSHLQQQTILKWMSGNRQGYYNDTLYSILVVNNLLQFAPYVRYAVNNSVRFIKRDEVSCGSRILLTVLLLFVVLPFAIFCKTCLFVNCLLGCLAWLLEDALGVILTIASMGLSLKAHQRWCHELFLRRLECVFGNLWHRSVLQLNVIDLRCEHEMEGLCSQKCYSKVRGIDLCVIKSSCKCLTRSIERALSVQGASKSPANIICDGNEFFESHAPFTTPLLLGIVNAGCCSLTGELHDPRYDAERRMWIETKVSSASDGQRGGFTFSRERNHLDEILSVDISEHDLRSARALGVHQLIYVPQFAAGQGDVLSCLSIKLLKAFAHVVTVAVGVLAVLRETEAGKIAAIVILLVFVAQSLGRIQDELEMKEWGLGGERIRRTFAIDALSSGMSADIVHPKETGWSTLFTSGSYEVGQLTWIENLVINRTIIANGKGLSLSRSGTSVNVFDVEEAGDHYHVVNWDHLAVEAVDAYVSKMGNCICFQSVGGENRFAVEIRSSTSALAGELMEQLASKPEFLRADTARLNSHYEHC